jgi:SHAQKYF class myb-like DNA-binding protein
MNGQIMVSQQNSPNSIVIDTSSDSSSLVNIRKHLIHKVPELDSYSNSEGNYQQGRWSHIEHLIFIACIIQFGRDWKKIEFYVQTRSSSQARSHAQKVLKKFDRPSLIREVLRERQRLDFDPVEYKCQSLSVFDHDNEISAIAALCGKKRRKGVTQGPKFMKISEIGKRYAINFN